jgi:hypothetical protein
MGISMALVAIIINLEKSVSPRKARKVPIVPTPERGKFAETFLPGLQTLADIVFLRALRVFVVIVF